MNFITKTISEIPLEGSEKQVQWARSIRLQRLAFFEKLGNRAVFKILLPSMVESEIISINAMNPKNMGLMITYTIIKTCSNGSAKWWIDSRTEDPLSWIPAAWEAIRQYHLQHPFADE